MVSLRRRMIFSESSLTSRETVRRLVHWGKVASQGATAPEPMCPNKSSCCTLPSASNFGALLTSSQGPFTVHVPASTSLRVDPQKA